MFLNWQLRGVLDELFNSILYNLYIFFSSIVLIHFSSIYDLLYVHIKKFFSFVTKIYRFIAFSVCINQNNIKCTSTFTHSWRRIYKYYVLFTGWLSFKMLYSIYKKIHLKRIKYYRFGWTELVYKMILSVNHFFLVFFECINL